MRFLRTNTATRITVGPLLDKTDGVTAETAQTVTSMKLTLVVDTAGVPTLVLDTAPTASGGSNDMVHVTGDDSGFYDLELAAADVNYLGRAMLSLNNAAEFCPVFHEFMILPAMIYDSLVLGTDRLDTNVTHVADTSQTAGDIPAMITAVDDYVDSEVGAIKTQTDKMVFTVANQLDVNVLDWKSATAPAMTGDAFARLGAPVGASISADIAGVQADTDNLQTRIPAALGANGNIKADIRDFSGTAGTFAAGRPEVNTTHVGGTSQSAGDIIGDTNDIQARLPAALTADGNIKADALRLGGTAQTGRDIGASVLVGDKTGFSLSSGGVQAIWDALTSALTTSGSIGKWILDKLDVVLSTRSATGAAMTLTSGERTSIANEVEAQIIDETDSEKVLTAITDKIAAINPDLGGLSVAAIATAVRDKALAGAAAGSIGEAISNTLADTNELQTDWVNGGRLDNILDARASQTSVDDIPTNAELATALGTSDDATLAALATAQADIDDIQARLPAALTAGGNIKADALALSGDTVAADNAESFFDGTGYAGTGNTIPTVTTLTNAPSDSSGTTTLLSRLSAARAGYLDVLNGLIAAIWAAVTDSSGTTTLLSRLTALRATALDNLDVAVSTRSTFAGGAVASVTGNVGGNVAGSVGSVTAGVVVTTNNDKTGYGLASDAVNSTSLAGSAVTEIAAGLPTNNSIADQVWDEALAGHATAGSAGAVLSATTEADLGDIAIQIDELYQKAGLDASNPMTVDRVAGTITCGNIVINMSGDGVNTETLTRQ